MKTLKEIITDYVKSVGGDGLCNLYVGCGCHLDDNIACDNNFSDCVPAKKTLCSECKEERPCEIQEEWGNDECYKRIDK